MNEITRLLERVESGSQLTAEELVPLMYDQLHALAATMMARERPGQTLQTTALINEAYLRLVDRNLPRHWDSPGHFFSAAAEAMRRILVEHARENQAKKRGGGWHRVPLEKAEPCAFFNEVQNADEILAVDETLDQLAAEDPAKAGKVAKLD